MPEMVDVIVMFELCEKFETVRFVYESPISTEAIADVQALEIWMMYGADVRRGAGAAPSADCQLSAELHESPSPDSQPSAENHSLVLLFLSILWIEF